MTGTGIFPGTVFSNVTGLTICFTETFWISSVDKKVKSTDVTSEATGFEMFMVGAAVELYWRGFGGLLQMPLSPQRFGSSLERLKKFFVGEVSG